MTLPDERRWEDVPLRECCDRAPGRIEDARAAVRHEQALPIIRPQKLLETCSGATPEHAAPIDVQEDELVPRVVVGELVRSRAPGQRYQSRASCTRRDETVARPVAVHDAQRRSGEVSDAKTLVRPLWGADLTLACEFPVHPAIRFESDELVLSCGRQVEPVRRPGRVVVTTQETLRSVLLHDPRPALRIDEDAAARRQRDQVVLAAHRVAQRSQYGVPGRREGSGDECQPECDRDDRTPVALAY